LNKKIQTKEYLEVSDLKTTSLLIIDIGV